MTEKYHLGHEGDGNGSCLPSYLKAAMLFIDRVGFPILAFIMMFVMSYVSLQKVTAAVDINTKALVTLSIESKEFRETVLRDHAALMNDIRKLYEHVYNNKSL